MRFLSLILNVTLLSSVHGAVGQEPSQDPGQDVCLGLFSFLFYSLKLSICLIVFIDLKTL